MNNLSSILKRTFRKLIGKQNPRDANTYFLELKHQETNIKIKAKDL